MLCDRLIPEDDFPSASQAGVVDYIDLQLATAWGQGEGLYLQGPWQRGAPEQGYQLRYTPAELYRRALGDLDGEAGANGFTGLGADDQEAYLARLESGEASPGGVPSSVFFARLWQNTLEGYFADPAYHGNRDYAGWRMLSFPGPHAHYLSEVDMHNMVFLRPPTGMTHDPSRARDFSRRKSSATCRKGEAGPWPERCRGRTW